MSTGVNALEWGLLRECRQPIIQRREQRKSQILLAGERSEPAIESLRVRGTSREDAQVPDASARLSHHTPFPRSTQHAGERTIGHPQRHPTGLQVERRRIRPRHDPLVEFRTSSNYARFHVFLRRFARQRCYYRLLIFSDVPSAVGLTEQRAV